MKKLLAIVSLATAIYLPTAYAQEFEPIHAETQNNVTCDKTSEDEIKSLFDIHIKQN
jgi:hypothetical protein